jgi:hypothetical protein
MATTHAGIADRTSMSSLATTSDCAQYLLCRLSLPGSSATRSNAANALKDCREVRRIMRQSLGLAV